MDAGRQARPGDVSRSAWIAAAIEEEVARDRFAGLKEIGSDHA